MSSNSKSAQDSNQTDEIRENLREVYSNPNGYDVLYDRILRAETIEDWSKILADYISWGNSKISGSTAIYNLNAAHDCPNKETQEEGESDTGLCQVPWDLCYAGKAERVYNSPLNYRRRQEFLWDCIDPETFAKAFLKVVKRKIRYGNLDSVEDVDLRLSESGDFRNNQDVYKADRIAEILSKEGITSYTYSASYKIEAWFDVNHIVLMQSVNTEKAGEYGDKEYIAFEISEYELKEADRIVEIAPEGTVWCPHDLEKRKSEVNSDEAISCGDCRLCLDKEGPDVAIPIHK